MKHLLSIVFSLFLGGTVFAQIISGNVSQLGNQEIKLEGFNGLITYPISSTQVDEKGNFKLTYSQSDYGVGYLKAADEKPLFVILSGEDIELVGQTLNPETLSTVKGIENQGFERYAKEHPRREQVVTAWDYLNKFYTTDSMFASQKKTSKKIQEEIKRIKSEDLAYIESLPINSYVRWFLPTRKFVSSVATIAQYRTDEIPECILAFRNLDYCDPRLYKSGLYRDALEGHFWLLENSGKPADSIVQEMKISIDAMMAKLITNEKIFNEVTSYVFDLLEQHSLFQASEYLALKILNEKSCTINSNKARQLETYRAMKKGNIAPEMVFDTTYFLNNTTTLHQLSDIKTPYTVVVFGASWCPKCKEELPEISKLYNKWKSNGIEVVFIALDEDKESFTSFASNFLFPCYSDFKKWNSKIVNDYYVFATPTIFLLNNKREIVLRPNSVSQLDAWVDVNLQQGK